jgi:hypothetical protein
MRRLTVRCVLALRCGGHSFFISFDPACRERLLDYLLELADDPDMPLTWDDFFTIIDYVGGTSDPAPAESRLELYDSR